MTYVMKINITIVHILSSLVPDDYLLNISIDISSINLALYIFVLGLRPSKILQGQHWDPKHRR